MRRVLFYIIYERVPRGRVARLTRGIITGPAASYMDLRVFPFRPAPIYGPSETRKLIRCRPERARGDVSRTYFPRCYGNLSAETDGETERPCCLASRTRLQRTLKSSFVNTIGSIEGG